MKKEALQFLSLIISSILLLYLLFSNIYNETFIFQDWVVVSVDLISKLIIEIIILSKK
ncbi:hypothetical protein J4417_05895 [Candidatus Woesearchaeota archaeon]|nr:hypothetical protein [Candidatus Woesearchaeota archaeon]